MPLRRYVLWYSTQRSFDERLRVANGKSRAFRESPAVACLKERPTCIVAIMLSEEDQFRALKLLERNPNLTQRKIAFELGVSVGNAHYMATVD